MKLQVKVDVKSPSAFTFEIIRLMLRRPVLLPLEIMRLILKRNNGQTAGQRAAQLKKSTLPKI